MIDLIKNGRFSSKVGAYLIACLAIGAVAAFLAGRTYVSTQTSQAVLARMIFGPPAVVAILTGCLFVLWHHGVSIFLRGTVIAFGVVISLLTTLVVGLVGSGIGD